MPEPKLVDQWFPYRTCINLDRRPDRWEAVSHQFNRHGFHPVTRFPACDASQMEIPADWLWPPGAYGCLQSHIDIVRKARASGQSRVLIFEDDVVLAADLETQLESILAEVPADWDMLSFGGIHRREPTRISTHIYRMQESLSTHAYALNRSIMDAFIERNEQYRAPVDVTNVDLQQNFRCYCTLPHLAWQEEGWSDVQQDCESQWPIRESLVLVDAEMDRILSQTTLVLAFNPTEKPKTAAQNLKRIATYYRDKFPSIEIVIVASEEATLGGKWLAFSKNFRFFTAPSQQRDHLFGLGYQAAEPQREFFIFSDHNLFPTRERFVLANLKMCLRYDGTNFFDHLIALNETDSALVRAGRQNQVLLEQYVPVQNMPPGKGAFTLTRNAICRQKNRGIEDLQGLSLYGAANRFLLLQ